MQRVAVDVVVLDDHGRPVHGLTQQQFHATEDGVPQHIVHFSEQTSDDKAATPPVELPKLPPNTFSNFVATSKSGSVTVLLYDVLNTPLSAQPYAHEQLVKFLKTNHGSSQIAIFVLSDKLHMLRGFTADDDALIAALNEKSATPARSRLLLPGSGGNNQSTNLANTDGSQNGASPTNINPSFQTTVAMLQHMESMEASAMMDQRVEITIEALEDLARFLVGIPGRKSLVWLSAAFPAGILPDPNASRRDAYDATRNYGPDIKEATNLLNLSHVAIYPIDVRGLQVNPMFNAGSQKTFQPGSHSDSKAVQGFFQTTSSEQATMDEVGEDTGGRAFYNTNGLKQAVSEAVDDSSNYYTVEYVPSDQQRDATLRKIGITVDSPGYHLFYRKSYFASATEAVAVDGGIDLDDALAASLVHGAPLSHELFFVASLHAYGVPQAATEQEATILNQYEATREKRHHKPSNKPQPQVQMQRYLIDDVILARQLDLAQQAANERHVDLQIAAMAYNDDGERLNGIRSTIDDTIPAERYLRIERAGSYQVVQTVAVPLNAASLRIAIRDLHSNHIGSLEIPLPLKPEATTPPQSQ